MRFLLVDRILALESGKRATGIKNVTMSEDFLTHHFPNSPIMPGTLITEALVQLANWIIQESTNFEKIGIAIKFEKIKFHRIVRPGDQLRLETEMISLKGDVAEVKAQAFCDGKLVTGARFTLDCQASESFQTPEDARRIFAMINY